MDTDFSDAVAELKERIDGYIQYDDSYFIKAGYNSPWEIMGRHNEVMLELRT